jgi:threonine dehydrogenase-like Zn-dependent dehydrogenase
MVAVTKELNIQFVLGYDLPEFAETLNRIAEGDLDVAPLITGTVDLGGVAGAFTALSDPDTHAKILVIP